jgi:hypothetical protein
MANEIRTILNSTPKTKNDWKLDWKEDVKVAAAGGIPKNDYGSDNASAPVNTVAPAITGTTTAGQTLTCSTGTWTGAGITYTYAWRRQGSNTTLGTATTYVLVAADQTKTITCIVTATNAFGRVAQVSNTTAAIA